MDVDQMEGHQEFVKLALDAVQLTDARAEDLSDHEKVIRDLRSSSVDDWYLLLAMI